MQYTSKIRERQTGRQKGRQTERQTDRQQGRSQDWSGGPKVANVSNGGPTVHQVSMLLPGTGGGRVGSGQPPKNKYATGQTKNTEYQTLFKLEY